MNLLISLVGLIIGFMIGLTGMGGGALTTPFLLLALGLDPVLAIGTDLTFAAITKIVGGIKHRQEENVSLTSVGWLAAGSLPASVFGAQIVLRFRDQDFITQGLPKILGFVLILVSLIIAGRVSGLLKAGGKMGVEMPSNLGLVAIGIVGGFLVGMTSIGGGTIIVALLLLLYSIPLNYIVGLDVVHGALLAGVSSLNYIFSGQVSWEIVGWLLLGSLPGVWFGAYAVRHIKRSYVRTVLAVFIFVAGVRLIVGGG